MKSLAIRSAPTLCAVVVAIVGHVIGFEELAEGGLMAATVLLVVAVMWGWPDYG